MPSIASRVNEIRPSPTIAMNARAAELIRAGRDIVPFSLGEPDFHTAENIKAAGIAAINGNFTKYTAADGFGPLKKAVANKLLRENHAQYEPGQIVIGSGAKVILLAAIMCTVNPGDEVIIPAPYWVTYPDHVQMAGGTPVFAASDATAGFKLTPEKLASVLTERTRALIFNSPTNPSGAVYTREEIQALGAVLKDHPDVWIITDELYEHLYYDEQRTVTFVEAMPELAGQIITINGFSKGYAMTGWRLGFAAGPQPVMKSIGDLLSTMTGSPNSVAQAAAIEALEGDQSYIARNRKTFQERRDFALQRLAQIPGLKAIKPAGTFYVLVDCAGWLGKKTRSGRVLTSDVAVVEALLEEADVATVPGEVFGAGPFIRMSIALGRETIGKGMDRIADFAERLR